MAEQGYRKVLEIDPQRADVWHLLGVLVSQLGEHEKAVDHLERAVRLQPEAGAFHTNLGVVYEKSGHSGKAVSSYRRALELDPESAGANNYLANALKAQGKLEEAAQYCRTAIRLNPAFAEAHNNLGSVLMAQGRIDKAVTSYRKAIEVGPEHAGAHNNLGLALMSLGELDPAVASFRKAVAINPKLAELHDNLGAALHKAGLIEEASQSISRALELKPDLEKAHVNLGNILRTQDKPAKAAACFQRALELDPRCAGARTGLAGAFRQQGRLEEAEPHYREALRLDPDSIDIRNDLGVTLHRQGKIEAAAECYRRITELRPGFAEAHNNLGALMLQLRRLPEAERHFREAVRHRDDFAEAWVNLGNALHDQGKHDEAAASYLRAVESDPDSLPALSQLVHERKHLCLWDELDNLVGKIISSVEAGTHGALPFNFINLPTSPEQQLRCAQLHSLPISERAIYLQSRLDFPFIRESRPGIRLGYLSADFRAHAISWLIGELIEKHDRDRFEVIGYSYGPDDGSATRHRIEKAFDRFVDIRDLSPADAARRIHDDGVDIAVDLSGYLPRAREAIMALRPAPVQVSFLGLTTTMGCDWIDYIIVDDFVVPPGREGCFTEKIVTLPDTYLVTDTKREVSSTTPTRQDCGLPGDGMIFCSFNQLHKITPDIFEVWMNLLKSNDRIVLWLWESNRFAPENLRREAASRGVDPSRIVFAPDLPQEEHLARYRLADLVLDTFPYNGHTTTADALWLGCPVLTCAGETFASRVAGSVLRAAGLPELITGSLEEYQHLALELANNPDRLVSYRQQLEEHRDTMALFDCGRFAGHIEQAFGRMWELHQSGKPPEGFSC